MNRPVVLGVAAWLTVGVAATAAGTAAIGMLEDGITGSPVRPLDGADVRRALSRAAATSPPSAPATLSPSPTAGGLTKVLAARGGTVTARCDGSRATLIAWSPAQGYSAGAIQRGPSTAPSLKFESASHEYYVTVVCSNGIPSAHSSADDHHGGGGGGEVGDDHGGGRGRGRHGGG